jgi:N-(2-amino-2-carboxyethyl)-L-glutamate synthase
VTVISVPQGFNEDDLYVDLRPTFGHPLFLKCEGFNFAGSIKLKAATEMVEAAERDGRLTPDTILVESSSGNLGVALSMIAASKGLRFMCVTDSRCNLSTRRLMEALGSQVHIITEPDPVGGFLGARLDYVNQLCASDGRYIWLNQYTNPDNWRAHYRRTAPAIARQFPDLDVLFVGAGTCGTLMGCARFFREWRRPVRIVAVDSVGSVTFGGPPGRRMIPGVGTSVRPPMLEETYVDDVLRVEEADTIRACHRMARTGFLFGGSTGTVVSGAIDWLSQCPTDDLTAVAIAPDLGERYLDTIYQSNWVEELYGEAVVSTLTEMNGVPRKELNGIPRQALNSAPRRRLNGVLRKKLNGATRKKLNGAAPEGLNGASDEELDGATHEGLNGASWPA